MKSYLKKDRIISLTEKYGYKLKAFIEPQIKLEDSSVLEIGTGNGMMTFSIAPFCKWYTAVEPSERMIESGKEINEHFKLRNLEWIKAKGEKLPKNLYEKYDLVIFSNSFHILEDLEKGFSQALLALKPGGIIWILEPNKLFADTRLQPKHSDYDEDLFNKKKDVLRRARHFLKSEATKDLDILHYSKNEDKVMFVFKKK